MNEKNNEISLIIYQDKLAEKSKDLTSKIRNILKKSEGLTLNFGNINFSLEELKIVYNAISRISGEKIVWTKNITEDNYKYLTQLNDIDKLKENS